MADDEGMEDGFLSSSESERVPISNYGTTVDLAPKKYGQKTGVGEIRNIKRFTWLEWVFIGVGVITFLLTLGLTIERFVHFSMIYNDSHNASEGNENLSPCHSWTCLSDVTFSAIVVVNIVFCLMYGVDGLLREKGYELLGVLVGILLVIAYLSTNFVYHMIRVHRDEDKEFDTEELAIRISRLVISWIFGAVLAVLSICIFLKMGRLQFTIVGGNRELMRAYKMASFLSTLLFYNIQAVVNILILAYVRQGTFLSTAEKVILPILVVYVILLTPVGYIGILYESYTMTLLFLVLLIPMPAYYIYKIVDVGKHYSLLYKFDKGIDNHYDFIAITMIAISILALLLYILIGIFGALVMRNFNKGLKNKIELPFFWCYQKLLAVTRRQ